MPNLNQGALASLIISIIIFIIVLILIIAVSYNWRVSTNNTNNQLMIKNPQFLAAAMYNKNNFASQSPPIGRGLQMSSSGKNKSGGSGKNKSGGSGKNKSGGSGKNKSGGSGMSAAAIAQLEANAINIANGCGDTAVVGVGGICKPIKSFYGAKDGFQNYTPPPPSGDLMTSFGNNHPLAWDRYNHTGNNVGDGGIINSIVRKSTFQGGSNYSAVMGQLGTSAINSANYSIPNGNITYLNGFQNYTPTSSMSLQQYDQLSTGKVPPHSPYNY